MAKKEHYKNETVQYCHDLLKDGIKDSATEGEIAHLLDGLEILESLSE